LLDIPKGLVGIIISALVLMPEGLAALQAARANRLQTSLNLALGSALASIGLTIPAVAAVSIALQQPITLGLNQKEQVLLALTLFIVSSPWVRHHTLGHLRGLALTGFERVVIDFAPALRCKQNLIRARCDRLGSKG